MTERDTQISTFIIDNLRDIGRRSAHPGLLDRIIAIRSDTFCYSMLATKLGITPEQIQAAIQEGLQSTQESS